MLDARVIREAEAALAALDLSAQRDVVAADLSKLAGLLREAIGIAKEVGALAFALGRPGPLSETVDTIRADVTRIAEGFARVAVAFDRARSAVLADAWPAPELVDVVRSHSDFALYTQLDALIARLDHVAPRARAYFDRAFTRVHADPNWRATVSEVFDSDGNPRGARLDELPTDLDG